MIVTFSQAAALEPMMGLDFIRGSLWRSIALAAATAGIGLASSANWAAHYLGVFGWMTLYILATRWLIVSAVAQHKQWLGAGMAVMAKAALLAGLASYYGAMQPPFTAFLAGMNTWFIVLVWSVAASGARRRGDARLIRAFSGPGAES